MKNLFFRLSCAVLLCCCLTGCGSIQHKSSTDTAQAQGTKAPPKTADDFSISSDSENETVDETSSADAATPSASESESITQQELLTGAAALYSNGQEISFDPSWQYADFSAISSGTATIYLADSDRKDIVVGVNAGHGTSGGASVKTQCHPDGSPKTTGGSTAQGATYATAVSGGMTFNDGTQFDSSYDRGEPLEFVCGAGQMIKGFDAAVADMEVGQVVDIHLMPEEAYGMPNPEAIFTVEIAELPGSEDLEVGQQVYLSNQYGQPFPVKVTAKEETTITFDANHEMAGKELNFKIELVSVE